jgi:hypothetical protein
MADMSSDEPRRVTASPMHWYAVDTGHKQQRSRASSSALRKESPDRALLDVVCRRSLILRVVQSVPLNAVLNVRPNWAIFVDITAAPVVKLDCHRCQTTHAVDTAALIKLARREKAGGRVRSVDVTTVLTQ